MPGTSALLCRYHSIPPSPGPVAGKYASMIDPLACMTVGCDCCTQCLCSFSGDTVVRPMQWDNLSHHQTFQTQLAALSDKLGRSEFFFTRGFKHSMLAVTLAGGEVRPTAAAAAEADHAAASGPGAGGGGNVPLHLGHHLDRRLRRRGLEVRQALLHRRQPRTRGVHHTDAEFGRGLGVALMG